MRIIALFMIFVLIFTSSAKVLQINGKTMNFFSGNLVNGSFMIVSKEFPENNVKGDILNGLWAANFEFNDNTKNIIIVTNTSNRYAYTLISRGETLKNQCKNTEIKLKINTFNQTPISMKATIDGTVYTNIQINPNQENNLNVCLQEGIYKIRITANDLIGKVGSISFLYAII